MENQQSLPHRKSCLAAGFIVSNLIQFFIGSFFFLKFWQIDPMQSEISLVLIGSIFLSTLTASVASYFWSLGGINLKNIRLLAIPNGSLIWFLYVVHPKLGSDYFFVIFGGVVVLFCAMLGTWFGRRFFYE